MKLLTSMTSPFGRKIRVILLEKNIKNCEVIDANAWDVDSIVAKHNPLGKVPVLLVNDEATIFDSSVIAEYLNAISSDGISLYACANEFNLNIEIKQTCALADGITEASVQIFYERVKREEHQRSEFLMQRQFGKIRSALNFLMQNYDLSQEFLFDNRLTMADISLNCALGYLKLRLNQDINLAEEFPQIEAYSNRILSRESFQLTTPA